MRNYVQPGDTIPVTAPYSVTPGQGVLVGSLFGVALNSAASSAPVEIKRDGVFDLTKATGEAWTVGARVYWDNTNRRLTTTATSNTLVGFALRAHLASETVGRAIITGQA